MEMIHFTQEASTSCFNDDSAERDIKNGLPSDCVDWLRSAEKNELDLFLADWMQLPSNLNDVEEFSDLVFSTIQYFSSIYRKRILSLQESFVMAIEMYSWPGGYLEWFRAFSKAISSNRSGHLILKDLPKAVLEKIILEV